MAEKIPAYVLDSFALLAYFQAEPGGLQVRALFEAARDQQAILRISLINVGELFLYHAPRKRSEPRGGNVA